MLHQKLFLSVAEVESFRPIQSSISPDQQINRLEDAIRGRARRKMCQAMDEMFDGGVI
jgi:hypothetical protein